MSYWVDKIVEDLGRNAVMLSRSEVSFQKSYPIDSVWNRSLGYLMWEVRDRLPYLHIEWEQQGTEVTLKISKLMRSIDWVLEEEPTDGPASAVHL